MTGLATPSDTTATAGRIAAGAIAGAGAGTPPAAGPGQFGLQPGVDGGLRPLGEGLGVLG